LASIKVAQATGEAFSPQKVKLSTSSKHELSGLFSIFAGYFCPPGSGSGLSKLGTELNSFYIQPLKTEAARKKVVSEL
jgi:hypothetical protein